MVHREVGSGGDALRCKVDDGIRLGDYGGHRVVAGDIRLDEPETGVVPHRIEVPEVAGVGQLVQDGDAGLGVPGEVVAGEGAADEPGPAGDDDVGRLELARLRGGHHPISLVCSLWSAVLDCSHPPTAP
jgi:hypothetical protein